jgi:coenzyme F420-0:L-glutamate ligase/coenzyme F420-1:gamma-L-glutamate ligase
MDFTVTLYPIVGLPLLNEGDDLAGILLSGVERSVGIADDDILVVAQKIVSKAEGSIVELSNVIPSERAQEIAKQTGRDPRLCQVYLDEATEVVAIKGRMVITRHRIGYVGSSSGVDRSNVAPHDAGKVVLLPKDPDASARRIRNFIAQSAHKRIAVIINDSCGRDYRGGSVGMAIGIAGISAIEKTHKRDLFDNESNSQIALVDELAASASILMGQANEGVPAVLVRGVRFTTSEDARITELLH